MDTSAPDKILKKANGCANLVLAATATMSLGAWFYCIYYYVWTGIRQFNSASDMVLFLCLPPVLAMLAFASLRFRPAVKVSITLLWSSAVASIYALEVLLTLWPSLLAGTTLDAAMGKDKNEKRQVAASFGVNFDTRDVVEVVIDAQARGLDVVPAVYPAALLEQQPGGSFKSAITIRNTEVLPLGGVSNKLSVLCNEGGDYTVYQSDEYGFNNPKGLWNSDRLDVAVVGDSFAHGFCIPSEKNFISLIRRRYPATLSLGMGGNGPLLELAAIKEFLPPLKPKIILWAYFEKNDLIELRDETKSPLLLQYLKPGFRQDLVGLQADLDQALLTYVEKEKPKALLRLQEKKHSKIFKRFVEIAKLSGLRLNLGFASGQQKPEGQSTRGDESADMALFRAILQHAKTTVETWGGSLYFLDLPPWERYAVPKAAKKNREEVLQMVASLNIPIIDIHASFQAHGDPLSLFPFRRSGHYNIEGNQVVADAVLKRIAQ
jgi:hypothetical protein